MNLVIVNLEKSSDIIHKYYYRYISYRLKIKFKLETYMITIQFKKFEYI